MACLACLFVIANKELLELLTSERNHIVFIILKYHKTRTLLSLIFHTHPAGRRNETRRSPGESIPPLRRELYRAYQRLLYPVATYHLFLILCRAYLNNELSLFHSCNVNCKKKIFYYIPKYGI